VLNEYGTDMTNTEQVAPNEIVTAVFSHPFHGRLVERVILYVRPGLHFKGENYKLSWWGDGVAYYEPVALS
jgi:hypothetical protein